MEDFFEAPFFRPQRHEFPDEWPALRSRKEMRLVGQNGNEWDEPFEFLWDMLSPIKPASWPSNFQELLRKQLIKIFAVERCGSLFIEIIVKSRWEKITRIPK